jgi:hypothetical protein
MPPTLIRRPATVTAWLILSVLVLLLSPVILLAGMLGELMLGRPQPRLVSQVLVSYCARELVVLVAAGVLWLATGCGLAMHSRRSQLLHLRLLRWFVHQGAQRVLTLLDLRVDPQPTPEAAAALAADRPLLFFSRHAGPGDTLLLTDLLMTGYERDPSVVFKQALTIDPCIDLLANRLPHAILDTSDLERCEARIAKVSRELGPRGILVLFPEGGNFTPDRRRRAIRHLRRKHRTREAAAGEKMAHLMPPHPSGAVAALRGNPEADVIFAAHTGLGLATFVRELWREVPTGRTLTARMWLVPAAERPTDPEAQTDWLYAWWKRLDNWVDTEGQEP